MRKSITLRVELSILEAIKKEAKNKKIGYQTLINNILFLKFNNIKGGKLWLMQMQ